MSVSFSRGVYGDVQSRANATQSFLNLYDAQILSKWIQTRMFSNEDLRDRYLDEMWPQSTVTRTTRVVLKSVRDCDLTTVICDIRHVQQIS